MARQGHKTFGCFTIISNQDFHASMSLENFILLGMLILGEIVNSKW